MYDHFNLQKIILTLNYKTKFFMEVPWGSGNPVRPWTFRQRFDSARDYFPFIHFKSFFYIPMKWEGFNFSCEIMNL